MTPGRRTRHPPPDPQEAIPQDVQDKVAAEMVAAFARAAGVPQAAMPRVAFQRCQLWGAALPLNTPGVECVLDPLSRVGICGDWLSGSSMQAAAVSGIALADAFAGLRGKAGPAELEPFSIGLRSPFKQLAAPGGQAAAKATPPAGAMMTTEIGQFPAAAAAVQ